MPPHSRNYRRRGTTNKEPYMEQYKTCSRCKQLLLISDFNKRTKTKDGLNYYCRKCDADARYAYRHSGAFTRVAYRNWPEEKKILNRQRNLAYNKANKHKRTLAMSKRRARQKQNGVFVIHDYEILAIQRANCFYCGNPGGEVDHVIPLSRGGAHSIGNLVPACRSCNSSKNNRFITEWRLKR